ncbi:hypothetical protein [Terricaulis sp.]|uniref:hypothetical protein n=1 Tax=Terricaulis sp. TaxID=2768686 RepID=UPI002AC63E87|nr:hypothetical protein [Terricaulis sp.]MDZ4690230.1 hypothetical protein [Terricaulis sp.]
MFDGTRRSGAALLGLAAFAAAITTAGFLALFAYESGHRSERQQASEYQEIRTSREVAATCVQDSRTRTSRCTANIPITDLHDPYAEHDLRAQQDMARWAFAIVLVSIGTLGLTGVGVLLLWWTLESTRDAVKAAGDANVGFADHSKNELRPYVFLDSLGFEYLWDKNDESKITHYRITLIWKNSGQTPAHRVHCWINVGLIATGLDPASLDFPDWGLQIREGSARPIGPGQSFQSRTEVPVEWLMDSHDGKANLFYWAWIEYDGFASDARHRTEACAQILVRNDPLSKETYKFMRDAFCTRFNSWDSDCVHKSKT